MISRGCAMNFLVSLYEEWELLCIYVVVWFSFLRAERAKYNIKNNYIN